MEIGYQTITWRGRIEEAFQDIAEAGFPGVEIANLPASEDESQTIRSLLQEHNIHLIGAYFGGSYIDAEALKYEMQHFEEACRFLQANGSRYIVVGGGTKKPTGSNSADYMALAEALEDMGLHAATHDLKLCYHPHRGTMVEFPYQIGEIAKLTDAELVSFCFDTAHLSSGGGDSAELCEKHKDRLAYVHLKDINDRRRFVELGEGEIDLTGFWTTLQSIGFDGPLIVELDASRDPRGSCQRNRKFLEEKLGITV